MTIIDFGEALASKLGPQWRHCPPQLPAYGTLLKREDGLWLQLEGDTSRVSIDASWEGKNTYFSLKNIPFRYSQAPYISCALKRGIPAIARDIRRRLLPDAEVWFADMEPQRVAWATHKQAIESICAKFQAFQGVTTATKIHNDSLIGPGFTVEVYQEHAVRINFGALAPDTAIELLTAYYKIKEKTS